VSVFSLTVDDDDDVVPASDMTSLARNVLQSSPSSPSSFVGLAKCTMSGPEYVGDDDDTDDDGGGG
jgi:hypothetical protein